jgi:hypothetical protein
MDIGGGFVKFILSLKYQTQMIMKNLLCIASLLFFGMSQAQLIEQNQFYASLLAGTNSSYSIKAEYSISKNVSLGLFYLNHKVVPITTNPKSKITNTTWGLESNYHLLNKNKFNLSAGIRLGYKNTSYNSKELNSPSSSYKGSLTEPGFVIGFQAGLRYQIANDFGLMVEYLSISESDIISGGFTYRF